MIEIDEHVIKGSVLDDIQHNHCRFNTCFHLRHFAAKVIVAILSSENKELKEAIEKDIQGKQNQILLEGWIGESIRNAADYYLDQDMGYGEDYWDEEDEEEKEEQK